MAPATTLASLALMLICTVGYVTQALAADDEESMTFTMDNDTITGSDNNYTNGVGFTWVSDDLDEYDEAKFVSRWGRFWEFLPFVGDEGYKSYAAWTLSHEMHTPSDIKLPDPPLDDQPYAGILAVDSILYARTERWTNAWELKLGVVGHASQADSLQINIHDLVNADTPRGWDHQLPNEAIINLGFTTAHLLAEGDAGESAQWRLVPVGSVSLGTYFTGVGLGMYGEVGWNLVDALGGNALREGLSAASTVGVGPVNGWSVSFFAGFGGHAVAHYLPLDGTVFRDSRSVDSKPFVGDATIGVNVRKGTFVMSLATTFSTKAFDSQEKSAEFGTLSMSWFH